MEVVLRLSLRKLGLVYAIVSVYGLLFWRKCKVEGRSNGFFALRCSENAMQFASLARAD